MAQTLCNAVLRGLSPLWRFVSCAFGLTLLPCWCMAASSPCLVALGFRPDGNWDPKFLRGRSQHDTIYPSFRKRLFLGNFLNSLRRCFCFGPRFNIFVGFQKEQTGWQLQNTSIHNHHSPPMSRRTQPLLINSSITSSGGRRALSSNDAFAGYVPGHFAVIPECPKQWALVGVLSIFHMVP